MKLFIELRVEYDDASKVKTIKGAARRAARQLLTVASLIQDRREPEIAVYSEDTFMGTEKIRIQEDTDDDEEPPVS